MFSKLITKIDFLLTNLSVNRFSYVMLTAQPSRISVDSSGLAVILSLRLNSFSW